MVQVELLLVFSLSREIRCPVMSAGLRGLTLHSGRGTSVLDIELLVLVDGFVLLPVYY